MSADEFQVLLVGALQGLGVSTVFLLALFIGFCILVGFSKHRPTGRKTLVVRNLDDRLGQRFDYLPPDAPRGPADQLRTPELLEQAARKE